MSVSALASVNRRLICICCAVTVMLPLATFWSAVDSSDIRASAANLNMPITEFDNRDQPLVQTLVGIAAAYHVPMGIEKVARQAVHEPIHVRLHQGTVRELLDLSVRQVPGYDWTVQDGAVDIYGEEEKGQESNLFNFVVSHLEVKQGTLNDVNARLRMLLPTTSQQSNFSSVPRGKVFSTFGDSPGVGSLESEHFDLDIRGATVRSVLNRIVVLSGGKVIWIARVPPDKLSTDPSQGLWLLLPPFPGGIVPYLDPSLSASPGKTGRSSAFAALPLSSRVLSRPERGPRTGLHIAELGSPVATAPVLCRGSFNRDIRPPAARHEP